MGLPTQVHNGTYHVFKFNVRNCQCWPNLTVFSNTELSIMRSITALYVSVPNRIYALFHYISLGRERTPSTTPATMWAADVPELPKIITEVQTQGKAYPFLMSSLVGHKRWDLETMGQGVSFVAVLEFKGQQLDSYPDRIIENYFYTRISGGIQCSSHWILTYSHLYPCFSQDST